MLMDWTPSIFTTFTERSSSLAVIGFSDVGQYMIVTDDYTRRFLWLQRPTGIRFKKIK